MPSSCDDEEEEEDDDAPHMGLKDNPCPALVCLFREQGSPCAPHQEERGAHEAPRLLVHGCAGRTDGLGGRSLAAAWLGLRLVGETAHT